MSKNECGFLTPPVIPNTSDTPAPRDPGKDNPAIYKFKKCPAGKSCYNMTAMRGKILSVEWDKQYLEIGDRKYWVVFTFNMPDGSHANNNIYANMRLADGVMVHFESDKDGVIQIEGLPPGNVRQGFDD